MLFLPSSVLMAALKVLCSVVSSLVPKCKETGLDDGCERLCVFIAQELLEAVVVAVRVRQVLRSL